MYHTILVAVALQRWERYSAHALAIRELAAVLATGAATPLHILSVYDYDNLDTYGLRSELAIQHREGVMRATDSLMAQKLDEYIAPLTAAGLTVTKILRAGHPREVIVQVATEVHADLLILGTHSKRGLFDIPLGNTAQHISKHAPCTVLLVSPHAKA